MKNLIIILLALTLSHYAHSQTEFHTELKYAQRLYKHGKYDDSVKILQSMIDNPKVDKKEFAELYLYLAFNYLKLNKHTSEESDPEKFYLAERASEEYFMLNSGDIPDLSKLGKEESAYYLENKRFFQGSLHITSEPESAEVYIYKKFYGKTPLFIEEIFADDHMITFVKGGCKIAKKAISVFRGDTAICFQKLDRDDFIASTKVITRPPGAEVLIDNTIKGYTPLFIDDLISGKYLIEIEKQGYEDFMMTKELKPHILNEISLKLVKKRDNFMYSIFIPGLGQVIAGYPVHGIYCSLAFTGYLVYLKKNMPERPSLYTRTVYSLRQPSGTFFYYVDHQRVSKEKYNIEYRKKKTCETLMRQYNDKKWSLISYGFAIYALNLLDTYLVIKHDERKKEKERLLRLGFKGDSDKVMVSMRIYF